MACKKERKRRYCAASYKRHQEKAYAYVRRKLAEDPDGVRAKQREYGQRYREKHPERQREATKRWQRKHPEKITAYNKVAYARRSSAPGSCSARQWEARVAYYGGRCWIPACANPGKEIDHIIPLSRGGSNWPANLRPVCKRHNAGRKNVHWRVYLAKLAA